MPTRQLGGKKKSLKIGGNVAARSEERTSTRCALFLLILGGKDLQTVLKVKSQGVARCPLVLKAGVKRETVIVRGMPSLYKFEIKFKHSPQC